MSINYTCSKCGLTYQGRLEMCPHCETIMNYPDTVYKCGNCAKPFKGKKEKCPHCNTVIKYAKSPTPEEIKVKWAKIKEQQKAEELEKDRKNKKNIMKVVIWSVAFIILLIIVRKWSSNQVHKALGDTYNSETIETDILGKFQCTSTVMGGSSIDQEFTINSDNTFSYTIYKINSSKVMTSGKGNWKLQATRDTTWNFGEIKNIEVFNHLILFGYYNDNYTSFLIKDSNTMITIFNNLFSMGEGQVFIKVQE